MKPTKKVNTQLASKRPFHTKGVMIRPYPPLFKIYQCYAQILNASQLPTHFQHDLNLVSTTKLTQAESFAYRDWETGICIPRARGCHAR